MNELKLQNILFKMPRYKEYFRNLLQWFQQQKFFLLNSLVVFLCFLFLPGILLIRGVETIAANHKATLDQQRKNFLHERLNELAAFSKNDRFAHYLLYHCCKNPDGTPKSTPEMLNATQELKRMFPEAFSFVIADKEGKVQRQISDEKSFLYLYQKAFALISELEAHNKNPKSPVPDLEAKLKRLRPFLGPLLREEDLLLPFKTKENGTSILVSGAERKFHLWYGSGKDFLLLAFISRDFIRGNDGTKFGTRLLGLQYPEIILGYSPYPPTHKSIFPSLSEENAGKVMRNLAEFENLRFEESIKPEDYMAIKLLNNTTRCFAFFKESANERQFIVLFYSYILRLLPPLILIIYVLFLKKSLKLSAKFKMLVFFSYAVLLPFLVIGSWADQYLKQAEEEFTDKYKQYSQSTIESIDEDYLWYRIELENWLSVVLNEFGKNHLPHGLQPDSLKNLHDRVKDFAGHDEFILVDNLNNDYMKSISARVMSNSSLIKKLCAGTLEAFVYSSARMLHQKQQYFSMIINAYKFDGKITFLGASELDMNIYYKLLIDPESELGLFPLIVWKESTLNKNYIAARLKKFNQKGTKFAVFCHETDQVFSSQVPQNPELHLLMKQASENKELQARKLQISGKSYLALAMPGQNLRKLTIGILFPSSLIDSKISQIKFKMNIGGIFLVILAAATFFLLQHLIFKPLDELKSGIESFSARNFKGRLNVICENELGRLMHAFNDSFETLQDLEVARIVQESILPEAYLKAGSVEVMAKTIVASSLGGDYYDMIKLDDDRILVFLGDATGHGIPAALSMAMAKAVFLYENQQEMVLNRFMDQIHKLYFRLKKQGAKDFMTCIGLELSVSKREASVINFGHPYPYLVKGATNEALQLSNLKGLPPGFGKTRNSTAEKIQLESGDSLILYTDGFIEATNPSGEIFGFERFAELLSSANNEKLPIFIDQVAGKITKWESAAGDDRTIIIVRV